MHGNFGHPVAIQPDFTSLLIVLVKLHLHIPNMLGQTVYKTDLASNQKHQIDLSAIHKGLYIVQLYDRNNYIRKKLIKQIRKMQFNLKAGT